MEKKFKFAFIILGISLFLTGCAKPEKEFVADDVAKEIVEKYDFYISSEVDYWKKNVFLILPDTFIEQPLDEQTKILMEVANDLAENVPIPKNEDVEDYVDFKITTQVESNVFAKIHTAGTFITTFEQVGLIMDGEGNVIEPMYYGMTSVTPPQLIHGFRGGESAPLTKEQNNQFKPKYHNRSDKPDHTNDNSNEDVEDSWTVDVDGEQKMFWELTKKQQEKYVEERFGAK